MQNYEGNSVDLPFNVSSGKMQNLGAAAKAKPMKKKED